MEHPTPHAAPAGHAAKPIVAAIPGGLSGASIGLGYFSMVVFWWYPFSPILAAVGLVLGLINLARGVRGPRGENFAFGGVCLCAISLSLTLTLNYALRYLQWDSLF